MVNGVREGVGHSGLRTEAGWGGEGRRHNIYFFLPGSVAASEFWVNFAISTSIHSQLVTGRLKEA